MFSSRSKFVNRTTYLRRLRCTSDVRDQGQRHEDEAEKGDRPGEAHRRLPSVCRKPTSRRSQSPEVESVRCGTPSERSSRASSVAVGRRLCAEPLAAACGCACRRAAGARTRDRRARGRRRPAAPARADRGSRRRRRRGAPRAGAAAAASRGGRGSRRRRRSRRAGGRAGRSASARRRATSGRRARDRAPAAARAGARAGRGALACRRGDGVAVAERGEREPVAATDGEVPDRERDAFGDVPLPPVGGAEGHRGRRVEQEPRLDGPLGDVDAGRAARRCGR